MEKTCTILRFFEQIIPSLAGRFTQFRFEATTRVYVLGEI